MVFHIGHLTVVVFIQPGFQSRGFFFEKTSFGYPARKKAESFGFGFN
jgi:hypothetical protein